MSKRKTRAELAAEAALQEQTLHALQAEQYLPKLMAALEEATCKNNCELKVTEGRFELRDRDGYDSRHEIRYLHTTYTSENWQSLESLEWDLERKAEDREEHLRLCNLRTAAFAKLTEEEQTALGLTDRNNW